MSEPTEKPEKDPLGIEAPYLTPKDEHETDTAAEIVALGQRIRTVAEVLCPRKELPKKPRWRRAQPIKPVASVTAPYKHRKTEGVLNRARLVRANVDADEHIELWVDATSQNGDGQPSPAVKHADIHTDGTLTLNPALYLEDGPTTLQQELDAAEHVSATLDKLVQENNRVRFVRVPMQVIVGEWSGGGLAAQPT